MVSETPSSFIYSDWFAPSKSLQPDDNIKEWAPLLDQLGLPLPDNKCVFRGNGHKSLFLDSHGVVIRLSYLDLENVATSGNLQPLGWVENKKTGLNAVLYPGLLPYEKRADESFLDDTLTSIMHEAEHDTCDIKPANTGVIFIDRNGQESAVAVNFDVDEAYAGIELYASDFRKEWIRQKKETLGDKLPSTVLREFALSSTTHPLFDHYKMAHDSHQFLRTLFWQEHERDPGKLQGFWTRCANLVERPERVMRYEWSCATREDGTPVWTQDRAIIENVALYRAWNGNSEDRAVKRTGPRRHWQDHLENLKAGNISDVPPALLEDKAFISHAAPSCPEVLGLMPENFRQDAEFMHSLSLLHDPVQANMIAKYASDNLRNDEEFMIRRIKDNAQAGQYVGDELRKNDAFFLRVIDWSCAHEENIPVIIEHLFSERRSSPKFISTYIDIYPTLYPYIDERLQEDEKIAAKCFKGNGKMIHFAPSSIQNNENLARIAAHNNFRVQDDEEFPTLLATPHVLGIMAVLSPSFLLNANPDLLQDEAYMLSLIQENPECYPYAQAAKEDSPDFLAKALDANPSLLKICESFHDHAMFDVPLVQDAMADAFQKIFPYDQTRGNKEQWLLSNHIPDALLLHPRLIETVREAFPNFGHPLPSIEDFPDDTDIDRVLSFF